MRGIRAIALTALGLKRLLGVPVWLGVLLLSLLPAVPLAVVLLRGPL